MKLSVFLTQWLHKSTPVVAFLLLCWTAPGWGAPNANRLQLAKKFEENFSPLGKPAFAWFASQRGDRVLISEPTREDESRGVTSAKWTLRLVDTETKRTVATRELPDAGMFDCEGAGPSVDVLYGDGVVSVALQWCRKTLWLDPNTLVTQRTFPAYVGKLSPDGRWYLPEFARPLRDSTPSVMSIRDVKTGDAHCSVVMNPASASKRGRIASALFSPDGARLAVFTVYSERGPGEQGMYFAVEQEIQIWDVEKCLPIAQSQYDPRGVLKQGPSAYGSRFAGPQWKWLVSSEAKTSRGDAIDIWDWQSAQRAGRLEYPGGIGPILDVSSDGKWVLATPDDDPQKASHLRDFVIWDIVGRQILYESPRYSSKDWLARYEDFCYRYGQDKEGLSHLRAFLSPLRSVLISSDKSHILHIATDKIVVYSVTATHANDQ